MPGKGIRGGGAILPGVEGRAACPVPAAGGKLLSTVGGGTAAGLVTITCSTRGGGGGGGGGGSSSLLSLSEDTRKNISLLSTAAFTRWSLIVVKKTPSSKTPRRVNNGHLIRCST